MFGILLGFGLGFRLGRLGFRLGFRLGRPRYILKVSEPFILGFSLNGKKKIILGLGLGLRLIRLSIRTKKAYPQKKCFRLRFRLVLG